MFVFRDVVQGLFFTLFFYLPIDSSTNLLRRDFCVLQKYLNILKSRISYRRCKISEILIKMKGVNV